VLIAVTGWMNQRQLQIIGYLREENRVLRERLGGRRVRLDKETLRLSVEPVQMSQVDVITPAASMPGAALSLSANGNTSGTAVLWASHPPSGNANQQTQPGILRAFDAENVLEPIWDSHSAVVEIQLSKVRGADHRRREGLSGHVRWNRGLRESPGISSGVRPLVINLMRSW
jgi:hypothetical protein